MSRVYLDYNATAPIRPQAKAAVVAALETGGNPSSIHAAGRAARALVERAREQVAALAGARPQDLTFTSGGTEANNLAIANAVAAGARRIIVGATEHPSVMEAAVATGLPVETWPVDRHGVADLDWLRDRLARWSQADGPPFVCLMLANNETGVIQPVAEAAELVHAVGGRLHCDAVQAVGKIEVRAYDLGCDSLSLSAHKLGGPTGAGALVTLCGFELAKQTHGGGQERGRRGGTENVPGIAGFGAAAEMAALQDSGWRDAAARRLKQEADVTVFGEGAERLPNTLCFAAEGLSSELQLMALDLAGVMVSSGSACSSGKVKASPVIAAMDFPDLAGCAIRVSGGWATTEADWAAFADAWLEAYTRRRSRARPRIREAV
ncbi:MAG TPA: cysteine desulfurase family protein [Caulobacteraceae bacterium]|jgi:cysteine desulfurase